jgi:hypothetical protein
MRTASKIAPYPLPGEKTPPEWPGRAVTVSAQLPDERRA